MDSKLEKVLVGSPEPKASRHRGKQYLNIFPSLSSNEKFFKLFIDQISWFENNSSWYTVNLFKELIYYFILLLKYRFILKPSSEYNRIFVPTHRIDAEQTLTIPSEMKPDAFVESSMVNIHDKSWIFFSISMKITQISLY